MGGGSSSSKSTRGVRGGGGGGSISGGSVPRGFRKLPHGYRHDFIRQNIVRVPEEDVTTRYGRGYAAATYPHRPRLSPIPE